MRLNSLKLKGLWFANIIKDLTENLDFAWKVGKINIVF